MTVSKLGAKFFRPQKVPKKKKKQTNLEQNPDPDPDRGRPEENTLLIEGGLIETTGTIMVEGSMIGAIEKEERGGFLREGIIGIGIIIDSKIN